MTAFFKTAFAGVLWNFAESVSGDWLGRDLLFIGQPSMPNSPTPYGLTVMWLFPLKVYRSGPARSLLADRAVSNDSKVIVFQRLLQAW